MLFGQDIAKPWIRAETPGKKAIRARVALSRLEKSYPRAKIALRYDTPMQLLAAVVLSAQATDKKVNEVTARLFKKYKTVDDFAEANPKIFANEIRELGFYRQKTLSIITSAKIILNQFGGKLPRTMEEMLTLRGVARKTANIVLGNAYGIVEGIAVDTHVRRLSQRLGFSSHDDPVKIERDLMKLFPKRKWFKLTYTLIDHGRAICTARNRKCSLCPVKDMCPASLV
ncbi:MAG: endonuclease III [Candidatus Sungbacteria bacterium]|uniref:Endonuclease III n=1 Tax=Candidatus Sungiibacteriota bacterium TaxID=2750080 RepID=A0A932YWU6_9BACT|nr:endonuclease III [Candidatus Sungbacteria bacterium]